jgi:hypothetical protein
MKNFNVKVTGNKALIVNISDKIVHIKKIYLVYETTVTTIEEKLGIQNVTEEKDISKDLVPNSSLEIQLVIPNLKKVIIVYTLGEKTFRDDIEI